MVSVTVSDTDPHLDQKVSYNALLCLSLVWGDTVFTFTLTFCPKHVHLYSLRFLQLANIYTDLLNCQRWGNSDSILYQYLVSKIQESQTDTYTKSFDMVQYTHLFLLAQRPFSPPPHLIRPIPSSSISTIVNTAWWTELDLIHKSFILIRFCS